MKARKNSRFCTVIDLFGLLMIVGSISYNSGVSYGEANAEQIRKSKIINVDSVVVENFVTAAYTLNEKAQIRVKSSGRIVPGKMIRPPEVCKEFSSRVLHLKKELSLEKVIFCLN